MRNFNEIKANNGNFDTDNTDELYTLAYKRMRRIKGFYTHLAIFIVINSIAIINNALESDNTFLWNGKNFSTAFFWGIGLTAHGLSVFGRNIFFGSKWEERKIQQLMEKEKDSKWE